MDAGDAAKTTAPTSPKSRKRGRTAADATDSTPVAKQHPSVPEDGADIDLGMLDQEAFARVMASGQQSGIPTTESMEQPKDVFEADEEDGPEVADDVTYRPSGMPDGADPIWSLRMTCLPVLDIFVSYQTTNTGSNTVEYRDSKDPLISPAFYDPGNRDGIPCVSHKPQLRCLAASL